MQGYPEMLKLVEKEISDITIKLHTRTVLTHPHFVAIRFIFDITKPLSAAKHSFFDKVNNQ